ncbi:hypothetical protein [uncultured Chryseobacterium sp.]|uniref:hypothetical protein n=1 Tax=uncultured Chryseobacterium sp. TaxID=259322 RepID=UPI0025D398B0|nr:hypothetical protein [uncultured Chryseobacterium sp.]
MLNGKDLNTADMAILRENEILKSNVKDNFSAKEAPPKKVKCACGKNIYGKDEAACKRICQFLKDGTYINGRAIFTPSELEQIKKDYLDGLMSSINGEEVLNPELFKPVVTAADLAGQKVSIKKSGKRYAYLGNQDELVKIISIPSARVQQCTGCNETDTCENSIHYACCCNGGYCWCLLCIEKHILKELPENKAVVTDGRSSVSPGNPQR